MKIVKDEETPVVDPQTEDVKTPAPIKFDINKNYKWQPDDVFYLKGSDFGLVLNTLRSISTSPLAQMIISAQKASHAMDVSLMAAVEVGTAVESETKK